MVLGFDFDAVAPEELESIVSQFRVKHGEDLGCYVVDGYVDVGN